MTEEGKTFKKVLRPNGNLEAARASDTIDRRHRELEALVQHSPDAILRFDAQKAYVFANWMAERYTGRPAQAMIGKRLDELPIPGDQAGSWSQALDVVFESAAPTSFEHASHTPRGERIFEVRLIPELGNDGEFDTVLAVARDITKQRRHERRLEESEERWRRLMDFNPEAVIVFVADRIVYGNRAAARLYRITNPAELVGRYVYDFFSAEDYGVVQQRLKQLYRGIELESHLYRIIRADGEERDVQVYYVPIKYGGKRAVQTVMHDVTEQRDYERHLIEARIRAEEIARLKSSIVTNLSHEIRTPLANVLGFNEILREHVDSDGSSMLDHVADGVERLMGTLTTVLELAHLEAGDVEPALQHVDAADEATRVIDEFRSPARRKNLALELSKPSENVPAMIDPGLFAQILRHLIDNAVKFTERGQISVELQGRGRDLYVEIADTGIGIGADFLPHVFDEFEQESKGLNRNYEGIGLGLSIVKRLAEICGAQISVESSPGAGSTFSVCFPGALPDGTVGNV